MKNKKVKKEIFAIVDPHLIIRWINQAYILGQDKSIGNFIEFKRDVIEFIAYGEVMKK